MKLNHSKLLFVKGSVAASSPKVGEPEPSAPLSLDKAKLLGLKGSQAATAAKVSAPEPTLPQT